MMSLIALRPSSIKTFRLVTPLRSITSSTFSSPETISSPTSSPIIAELISNRKAFKSITPPPALLSYIRNIGVGIPNKRSTQERSKPIYSQKKKAASSRAAAARNAPPAPNFQTDRVSRKIKNYDPAGKINYSPMVDRRTNTNVAATLVEPPPAPFMPIEGGYNGIRLRHTVAHDDPNLPLPNSSYPEVALIGRSNVGKSTLINALLYGNRIVEVASTKHEYLPETNRHTSRGKVPDKVKMPRGVKALMSDKPGETKTLAFFRLKNRETDSGIDLVDMPGYGFSFHGKTQEETSYSELAVRYVTAPRSKALKRLLLLVDARHGMKNADFEFLQDLESRAGARIPPIQIVLTKADMVEQADLARRMVLTKEQMRDAMKREHGNLPIMLVSAKPGKGFNNVGWTKEGKFGARGGILELQKEIASYHR